MDDPFPDERLLGGSCKAGHLDRDAAILRSCENAYRLPRGLRLELVFRQYPSQDESAAAEFKETIRLNPQYVKAHANLGVALAKLRRNAEAVRAFDKALELDPNNKQLLEFRQRAQGR